MSQTILITLTMYVLIILVIIGVIAGIIQRFRLRLDAKNIYSCILDYQEMCSDDIHYEDLRGVRNWTKRRLDTTLTYLANNERIYSPKAGFYRIKET